MTNATTMLRLELDQCDPHTLGFLWGLTSSVSKDDGGNLLLARLSQRFEREYAARTGKVVTVTNLPTQNSFDLEGYSIQDLRKAYAHFSCLDVRGSVVKCPACGF